MSEVFTSAAVIAAAGPLAPSAGKPGVVQMGKSLGAAAVKFAAGGGQTVGLPVFQGRTAICKACDQLQGARCQACGCFIAVKAWLPQEACPLQKWLPS